MQQININDEQDSVPTKSSRNEKLFLVIVAICFLYGTIFGFILYALPKFLISKFLLKKEDVKSRMVRDTAIAGLILGALVLLGTYSDNQSPTSTNSNEAVENNITKSTTDEGLIDNLYRNTKYNFRIKFPEGWEIKNGDGQNIIKKASKDESYIGVGVVDVSNFEEANNVKTVTEIMTLDEFLKSAEEELKPKFTNFKMVDSGETKIDNLPTYFVTYDVEYSVLDTNVKARTTTYQLFYNKRFYLITLASEQNTYAESRKILEESLSTFVIESAY